MTNLTAMKDQLMTNQTPLPLRNDTILGVCEAIGRDFGFNPIWLRLAFIAPLFFAPTATIGAYLGLGVIVGLINCFAPDKPAADQIVDVTATRVEDDEALPLAA